MTSPIIPPVSPVAFRWLAALTGLTSLGVLIEAVFAGQFVSQDHRDSWIAIHNMTANVVLLLALATMVVAIIALRRALPAIMWGSVALFVLLVVQTVLGNLITEAHVNGLIGVHVPLAVIIFGLTVWLPIATTGARRRTATV